VTREASLPDPKAALRDHLVASHPDIPAEEEDPEALFEEYACVPAAVAASE
jgi:hypothetical protein